MSPSEALDQAGQLILAAGGIVERQGNGYVEILLVHRQRYGEEWSLPKGKQDAGESLQETALREVLEETGCPVRFSGFGGCTHYYHGKLPKVVLYWRMVPAGECCFVPSAEVDGIAWLAPQAAVNRLAHEDEQALVSKLYGLGTPGRAGRSGMSITVKRMTEQELAALGVREWPIWVCEPSEFDWHYDQQESCFLLAGEVTVRSAAGEVSFGAGDFVTFPRGLDCTWQVSKAVRCCLLSGTGLI